MNDRAASALFVKNTLDEHKFDEGMNTHASKKAAFVLRAHAVHGTRYNYDQVVYRGTKGKVSIQCPEHGLFEQSPQKHLVRGQGCPACGRAIAPERKRFSLEQFIGKSRALHGNKYDYSHSIYGGSKKPIKIICPEHGAFMQKPEQHWDPDGAGGCTACVLARHALRATGTQEAFIEKARVQHGNSYNYSAVQYRTSKSKVIVRCPTHGLFEIRPDHHLSGSGCPQCGVEKRSDTQRRDEAYFKERAQAKHGEKYDYSRVRYLGAKNKVEIVCKSHGPFWQEANAHMGRIGCPSCAHHYSEPHKEIEAFLASTGESYRSNSRAVIPPKELDIWMPERQLAIEMNGVYWHALCESAPATDKFAHRDKFRACQQKGILLLQIGEFEWKRERSNAIWKSIIRSKLGLHERVHARSCRFMALGREEANEFLEDHHLQGSTNLTTWCYGLRSGDQLAGVICFSHHEKRELNLSRLAFRQGLTIVGGAAKLFRNALDLVPRLPIVTFSDNRYSRGDLYPKLGFRKHRDLQPSYQWFFENRLWNKRHMRHSSLARRLGASYDPDLTEQQNMFRAGARCLYDAGYQKWVFDLPR